MAERQEANGRGGSFPSGRLALGLGTLLAVLALAVGAALLVSAADGPADPVVATSNGGGITPTPTPTASPAPTPTPLPNPTPLPSPTPTAEPEEPAAPVSAGGDQPIGPRGTLTAGTLPENVGLSPEFQALREALAREIKAYRAQVGPIEVAIAVTDLQTGETLSVNGNRLQRTGCTINLFALLAVVGEFQAGRADPDRVAASIRVGIGGSYPPEVRRFLEAVFGDHREGVRRAQELMRFWGMEASVFDHVPYYGDGTQNNLLTALETNLALSKLYRGQLFNPQWTAYALARLREINPGLNYMLPGRLPASASVAHKIGYYWDWDGAVNNDAGIVTFKGADGREKAYAITYLSQKAPTEYAGYSFGAKLSRIVWDYFAEKYGAETSPPPPAPAPPPLPPAPTPTPTPQPTATPTSGPSREPTPTAEPSPVAEPSPAPSPAATPAPLPSPQPTPGAG